MKRLVQVIMSSLTLLGIVAIGLLIEVLPQISSLSLTAGVLVGVTASLFCVAAPFIYWGLLNFIRKPTSSPTTPSNTNAPPTQNVTSASAVAKLSPTRGQPTASANNAESANPTISTLLSPHNSMNIDSRSESMRPSL